MTCVLPHVKNSQSSINTSGFRNDYDCNDILCRMIATPNIVDLIQEHLGGNTT